MNNFLSYRRSAARVPQISIRGTNNQLSNMFYKFVIFNCLTLNINLFILNLFDVKFLFSEYLIFPKQKGAAVYGHASLVSDFKLTPKNDDLLSSRHK